MSAAAFTDSTTPEISPLANVRPTAGRSTNTTSPSASCACSVMPTTAASWSSSWIHSCSGVYLTVMGLSSGGRAAVVTVGNERHGTHLHGDGPAAHDGVQAGAAGGELR